MLSTTKHIRICIVEDDEWLRNNLGDNIKEHDDLELVNTYPSAETALHGVPIDQPDVVIMDINLPKMNGIDCVRKLKENLPNTQFMMLTAYEDSDQVFDSLLAGASGYLLKSAPQTEIIEAISQVAVGGSPMTGHIARKVVQYFNQVGTAAKDVEKLTPREKEILDHLAHGASSKEIASDLSLSFDTVRMHTKSIYKKLHVHSRSEALTKYFRKAK